MGTTTIPYGAYGHMGWPIWAPYESWVQNHMGPIWVHLYGAHVGLHARRPILMGSHGQPIWTHQVAYLFLYGFHVGMLIAHPSTWADHKTTSGLRAGHVPRPPHFGAPTIYTLGVPVLCQVFLSCTIGPPTQLRAPGPPHA